MDKYTADMVFSECDRSKTGSDKFYEFKYNDLQGQEVSLRNYTNHVTLIVNVASFWGLTKQNYEELNALLDEYGGEDACSLKVIAFPSGQFHNQEPDKPEELLEILKFVRPGKGFIPKMDFSTKVDVNGKDESPVFTFLKDICPRPSEVLSGDGDVNWKPLKISDVRWNFEKFLLDHKGIPVRRYLHWTMPMELKDEIATAIKNCTNVNTTEEEKRKQETKEKDQAELKEEQMKSNTTTTDQKGEQKGEQNGEQKPAADADKEKVQEKAAEVTSESRLSENIKNYGRDDEPIIKNENLSKSPLIETPKMEQGQLNQNPDDQKLNNEILNRKQKRSEALERSRKKYIRMLRKTYL